MKRLLCLLALLFSTSGLIAAVIGVEQPEIKLSDGKVITRGKVLDYSSTKGTAVVADDGRLQTIPLAQLPPDLRTRLLTEPSQESRHSYNVYREGPIAPPPQDKTTTPPTPITAKDTANSSLTSTDLLIEQAKKETADELKFYLIKAFNQVTSLTTKIRKAEQVPGWSKIRISGEAAYSMYDNYRNDYTWRTGKFEVEFAIIDGRSIRIDTISFGGISRQVDSDFDK